MLPRRRVRGVTDPLSAALDFEYLLGLVEGLLGFRMVAGLVQLLALLAQIHNLLLVRGRELSRLHGFVDGSHVLRATAGEGRIGIKDRNWWRSMRARSREGRRLRPSCRRSGSVDIRTGTGAQSDATTENVTSGAYQHGCEADVSASRSAREQPPWLWQPTSYCSIALTFSATPVPMALCASGLR
jgi:hypothetical protein